MEALAKLQQLSLVSKVVTELNNNLAINDPTLGTSLCELLNSLRELQLSSTLLFSSLSLSS